MAPFGNILTLFTINDMSFGYVEAILLHYNVSYEKLDSTFFIKTISKEQTRNLIEDINNTGVDYIHIYINNSDPIELIANGIDDVVIRRIRRNLILTAR